jgi:hypothetical protein
MTMIALSKVKRKNGITLLVVCLALQNYASIYLLLIIIIIIGTFIHLSNRVTKYTI